MKGLSRWRAVSESGPASRSGSRGKFPKKEGAGRFPPASSIRHRGGITSGWRTRLLLVATVALLGPLLLLLVASLALGVERLLRGEFLPVGLVAVTLGALLLGPGLVLVMAGGTIHGVFRVIEGGRPLGLRSLQNDGLVRRRGEHRAGSENHRNDQRCPECHFPHRVPPFWNEIDENDRFESPDNQHKHPARPLSLQLAVNKGSLRRNILNTNLTLPSPPLDVHNVGYPQAIKANHPGGGSN